MAATKTKAISGYEIDGDVVKVSTPYAQDIVKQCKAWGGKWIDGQWHFPLTRLDDIRAKLGSHESELVEVECDASALDDGPQLLLDWYVLASRRGRDYSADIYAELVAGEIPLRGGSKKNPLVDASDDARFRFVVPRDFAARDCRLQLVDAASQAESQRQKAIEAIRSLMREHGLTTADLA